MFLVMEAWGVWIVRQVIARSAINNGRMSEHVCCSWRFCKGQTCRRIRPIWVVEPCSTTTPELVKWYHGM